MPDKIPGINLYTRKIPGTAFINSLKNRFYSKVSLPTTLGCMEWVAATKYKKPYGSFIVKGKRFLAHRFSYLLHFGSLPDDKLVLHKCNNPRCVAPKHLKLGTYKSNAYDTTIQNRWGNRKGSHGSAAKLSIEQVNNIKLLLIDGYTQIELGKLFKVSQGTISRIKLGKREAV